MRISLFVSREEERRSSGGRSWLAAPRTNGERGNPSRIKETGFPSIHLKKYPWKTSFVWNRFPDFEENFEGCGFCLKTSLVMNEREMEIPQFF
ncbi:hypothetical protein CDAR_592861 [Caerostris darwini]|uniref:Uncharacterized protein n=1 Tax=Caerostris darwini TaxID=1538125 RepID=A0AAV4QPH5_9ARAC|nr:hypothetical protein CDAR_592861 [Caerostris darwini]